MNSLLMLHSIFWRTVLFRTRYQQRQILSCRNHLFGCSDWRGSGDTEMRWWLWIFQDTDSALTQGNCHNLNASHKRNCLSCAESKNDKRVRNSSQHLLIYSWCFVQCWRCHDFNCWLTSNISHKTIGIFMTYLHANFQTYSLSNIKLNAKQRIYDCLW
jgi:hypothetical protein